MQRESQEREIENEREDRGMMEGETTIQREKSGRVSKKRRIVRECGKKGESAGETHTDNNRVGRWGEGMEELYE